MADFENSALLQTTVPPLPATPLDQVDLAELILRSGDQAQHDRQSGTKSDANF